MRIAQSVAGRQKHIQPDERGYQKSIHISDNRNQNFQGLCVVHFTSNYVDAKAG